MTCITIDVTTLLDGDETAVIKSSCDTFIRAFGRAPSYLYVGHGTHKILKRAVAENSNVIFDRREIEIETFFGMKVLVVGNDYFHFRMTA